MEKKTISDTFKWLEEVMYHKTPVDMISEESWSSWNTYMINRFLSNYQPYVELVNYVAIFPPDNKKQIYSIYREMLPKKKFYLRYVKSKRKQNPSTLVEYVAKYYECSLGEADEYIDILRKPGVTSILYKMGVDDTEIKKLFKHE